MNQNKNAYTRGTSLALVVGMAVIFAPSIAAEPKPEINEIVRKFHVNYSAGDVEENGHLVNENIVVYVNAARPTKSTARRWKAVRRLWTGSNWTS
ncbi:hypothetical protein [Luteimonas salinilitoris]|uniref:Uncharacterized protein n=1 Tax=Luteimonas salinilitoris TaxID=3237697 RepID=A0ABV4HRE2_9GAMM